MAEEEEIVETDPYCTSDRFAAKNGIKAIEVGEDYSVCTMPIDETCLNGIGIPMGGCYFTLGDLLHCFCKGWRCYHRSLPACTGCIEENCSF